MAEKRKSEIGVMDAFWGMLAAIVIVAIAVLIFMAARGMITTIFNQMKHGSSFSLPF